jgi:hypothetical protein
MRTHYDGRMSSQHAYTTRTYRPTRAEADAAGAVLVARGWTRGDYIRAALRWLVSDPDAALAALGHHRPPPRPVGRPPRRAD